MRLGDVNLDFGSMSGAWIHFCWLAIGRSKYYFFNAQGRCFYFVCFELDFGIVDTAVEVIFKADTKN